MSLAGDLTGLVGLAVVGAVAVKTIDVLGNVVNNPNQQKKKKKSKKKSKSNNIFDMGNMDMGMGNKKSSKKMKGADNIFSTGFF